MSARVSDREVANLCTDTDDPVALDLRDTRAVLAKCVEALEKIGRGPCCRPPCWQEEVDPEGGGGAFHDCEVHSVALPALTAAKECLP